MATVISGDTGIDKITDGSVVAADIGAGEVGATQLASTLDLSGKTITLPTATTVDKLSTASGSAPSYSARAWVNFNGTGTVAIRDSGNVSSITDNGTGSYTVNFTTAMSDTDYCGLCNGSVTSNDLNSWHGGVVDRTTSSFRVDVENLSNAGQRDPDTIYAVIFQ